MRTLDELEDGLGEDLAWRRVELQALRAATRSSSGPTREAQCRAGVALLYAHWEGYVRFALSGYLKFVALRRLRYGELQAAFVARGAAHEVRAYGRSEQALEIERARWILAADDHRCRISPKTVIDTRSNLSSAVCEELLHSLGLESKQFSTKAHFIDYSLVRARNEIAHGQWLGIEPTDYDDLHDEVMGLLATMRTIVVHAAEEGSYSR